MARFLTLLFALLFFGCAHKYEYYASMEPVVDKKQVLEIEQDTLPTRVQIVAMARAAGSYQRWRLCTTENGQCASGSTGAPGVFSRVACVAALYSMSSLLGIAPMDPKICDPPKDI